MDLERKNKAALISWALLNNNAVNSTLYLLFMVLDFFVQVCYLLKWYHSANSFFADMDFLKLIIGAVSDDEDPAAVAGIAVSVLLLLLAALVAGLVLKDINIKFYKGKNLLF